MGTRVSQTLNKSNEIKCGAGLHPVAGQCSRIFFQNFLSVVLVKKFERGTQIAAEKQNFLLSP
jgi:hypothetical protein